LLLCAVIGAGAAHEGAAAPAAPPNPGVTPIRTPTPRPVPMVELTGAITYEPGIKPIATPGKTKPIGTCNQIKITAFRTADEYDRSGILRERESTYAKGLSIERCTYALKVPAFVEVRFDATTTIPGHKVVISWNENSSSTGTMLWGDPNPVFNWKLKPIGTALPAAPRK
jgi:hypothetical protein